jgi:hypothetical protein
MVLDKYETAIELFEKRSGIYSSRYLWYIHNRF